MRWMWMLVVGSLVFFLLFVVEMMVCRFLLCFGSFFFLRVILVWWGRIVRLKVFFLSCYLGWFEGCWSLEIGKFDLGVRSFNGNG